MNLEESREIYKNYIDEHRKYVEDASAILIKKGFVDPLIMSTFLKNIKYHDQSKYSKEEFEAYRQYFYPADNETKDESIFNKAWEHHKTHNPHHWEVWTKMDIPFDLQVCYFLEMICDWMAMSMKFGGTAREYYEENKEEIKLSKTFIRRMNKIFDVIYETKENN